ncbi:hypothetical protein EDB81DRAFT_692483 [Dactylonectria macrodidyma]|uniref:Tail specific protease domain-containing protein n=1 Tax=Dactylonectria macrodidyma TaxID=307937 RepID=A0A9P9EK27_9HYPO|nr:hypothetical protein EDB81DRAFT_692483 [Dactylonectria macrodidyma]
MPALIHARDIADSGTEPCKILSKAYEALATPGKVNILPIAPSVGLACLKSVPLDKKRDLALLDYLLPFVSFQSTLENLADPPEGYLIPGVDVLGGIEAIRTKLQKDQYDTQYEVMTDLERIFWAAGDGHFAYGPALTNTFFFARPQVLFQSVSIDGVRLPNIFMLRDILAGNHGELDYRPSALESIDGHPIAEWIENDAAWRGGNAQDPDAQYNSQFFSLARQASGGDPGALRVGFEIPDNYTLSFYNGTTKVVDNMLLFLNGNDFSGINSGEEFHQLFEIPPATTTEAPSSSTAESTPTYVSTAVESKTSTAAAVPTVPGYPYPVVKHSRNSFSGYFLNESGFEDTAVLSVLEFQPGSIPADFNGTEYMLEAKVMMSNFFKAAKKANRDKLIIDLSNNGGGYILLAEIFYAMLFPQGKISNWGRYRANEAFEAYSEASWKTLVSLEFELDDSYPYTPEGEQIKNGKEWFGPYSLKGGQNVTAAARSSPLDPVEFMESFGASSEPDEAPFRPENILIVTDGICASSCTILTGLLTRNHGIRTLALGGRPMGFAMQAMGGVKGTRLQEFDTLLSDTLGFITAVESDADALQILSDAADSLPGTNGGPPLVGVTGAVNYVNGYMVDDLEGYPVHFKYEAANGRLFYTQMMLKDVSEIWRRAAAVAWKGASCVLGSTKNQDGTMADEPLPFDARVKSRASKVKNPGMLN